MPDDSHVSRRRALGAMAGGAASLWMGAGIDLRELAAAGLHAATAMRQQPRPPFQVLTPEQAADIEAFTARIIPSDDGTPGAKEAGVVYFADKSLATFAKDRKADLEKSLTALSAEVAKWHCGVKSFAALESKQQDRLIEELAKADSPIFHELRGLTIGGMFSNPDYGGNRDQVGGQLLGWEDRASWQAPFGYYDRDVQ